MQIFLFHSFTMILKTLLLVIFAATAVIGLPDDQMIDVDGDSKIVGGSPAEEGQIPWQIGLKGSINSTHYSRCGGSIISKDWILTVAHCSEKPAANYTVRAGSLNYSSGGEVHSVTEVIFHPNYNFGNVAGGYDIALMKVSPPFTISPTVQAIKLPDMNAPQPPSGTPMTVSGFGRTAYNESSSPVLMFVEVLMYAVGDCRDYQIAPGLVCAGWPQGGMGTCRGDSGGPLFEGGMVFGLDSHAKSGGCSEPDSPTMYTEVAFFRDWIAQHTDL